MAEKKDYYEVLGVPRTADADELKRTYRKLARKYHPDVNKEAGAEEHFKDVAEAYAVLSNPDARARYDQWGHAAPGGFHDFEFDFSQSGFPDLFDLFNIFSGGQRARGPSRGTDMAYELTLDLHDAAFGTERKISVRKKETCEACRGSGAASADDVRTCEQCGGQGQVQYVSQSGFGRFVRIQDCPKCHGRGKVVTRPCPECGGAGRQVRSKRISVKIPAGIDEGAHIRIAGEGTASPDDGPPGDLYVTVHVKPDPKLERLGYDLVTNLPVTITQAALGEKLEVETLDGTAMLNVPPGTQGGTLLRLRGRGIPRLDGRGRGDLLVRIQVLTAVKLTPKQRELLLQFQAEERPNTYDTRKGLFGKIVGDVKDAFE